jgi:hypothetical protein
MGVNRRALDGFRPATSRRGTSVTQAIAVDGSGGLEVTHPRNAEAGVIEAKKKAAGSSPAAFSI